MLARISLFLIVCLLSHFSSGKSQAGETASELVSISFSPPPADIRRLVSDTQLATVTIPDHPGYRWYVKVIDTRGEWRTFYTESNIVGHGKLRDWADIDISLAKAFQRLTLHRIAIKRDEKVIFEQTSGELKMRRADVEDDWQFLNTSETYSWRPDNIATGDEVIAEYSVIGENSILANIKSDIFIAPAHPSKLLQFVYLSNRTDKINAQVRNLESTYSEQETPDGKALKWTAQNYPGYRLESETPYPVFNDIGQIWVSELNSWPDLAPLFIDILNPQHNIGEQLAKHIREKFSHLPDTEQIIREATRFVQDDISYFSVSWGASAMRPRDPNHVFLQRFGDCKDKVNLLRNILAVLGIESNPVLVSARLKQHRKDYLPSPHFDHVILNIISDEKSWFVDATARQQADPLSDVSRPDMQFGILVTKGAISEVTIPTPTKEMKKKNIVETLKFDSTTFAKHTVVESVPIPNTNVSIDKILSSLEKNSEFKKAHKKDYARQYGAIRNERFSLKLGAQGIELHQGSEIRTEMFSRPQKSQLMTGFYDMRSYWPTIESGRKNPRKTTDFAELNWVLTISKAEHICRAGSLQEPPKATYAKIEWSAVSQGESCVFSMRIEWLGDQIESSQLSEHLELQRFILSQNFLAWTFEKKQA